MRVVVEKERERESGWEKGERKGEKRVVVETERCPP